jgi:hypothetical protein
MAALAQIQTQAVTGVTTPSAEALIREIWPSVTASPAAAGLAKRFQQSIILAPLGWLVLAPLFGLRFLACVPGLGGLAKRYRLTNKRLAICTGFPPTVSQEVALDRIRDVKIINEDDSGFYLAGTMEIIDVTGRTVMTLPGVPEPESVKHSILQAATAWGPLLKS